LRFPANGKYHKTSAFRLLSGSSPFFTSLHVSFHNCRYLFTVFSCAPKNTFIPKINKYFCIVFYSSLAASINIINAQEHHQKRTWKSSSHWNDFDRFCAAAVVRPSSPKPPNLCICGLGARSKHDSVICCKSCAFPSLCL